MLSDEFYYQEIVERHVRPHPFRVEVEDGNVVRILKDGVAFGDPVKLSHKVERHFDCAIGSCLQTDDKKLSILLYRDQYVLESILKLNDDDGAFLHDQTLYIHTLGSNKVWMYLVDLVSRKDVQFTLGTPISLKLDNLSSWSLWHNHFVCMSKAENKVHVFQPLHFTGLDIAPSKGREIAFVVPSKKFLFLISHSTGTHQTFVVVIDEALQVHDQCVFGMIATELYFVPPNVFVFDAHEQGACYDLDSQR